MRDDFLVTLFHLCKEALCEMCPNRKVFLVRILPHSDWMRRDTSYLSVFSPNAGKYEPENVSCNVLMISMFWQYFVKEVLPENHLSRHVYRSKKLGSFLNIKDQTKLEHINDLIYFVRCPEETWSENYLGETTTKNNERVIEHAGKDIKSNMLGHQVD